MTTIAFRGPQVSGDSQVSWNSSAMGQTTKVAKVGPILVAACGDSAFCRAFRGWVVAGMKGDAPPLRDHMDKDNDALGVISAEDGRYILFNSSGVNEIRAPFFAIGSGQEYALGAMAMGADPEAAVRVAIRFDNGSGGDVTTLWR